MVSTGGATYRPTVRRPSNGGARAPVVKLHAPNAGLNGGVGPPTVRPHAPNAGFNGGAQAPASATLPPAKSVLPLPPPPPVAPAPPPLDSRYFNDWALAQFKANASRTELLQQHDLDVAQRDTNLQQLGERQPVLQQQMTNTANARGLLYSGALGSQLGDLASSYAQNVGKVSDAFGQRDAQRTLQLQAIDAGLPYQQSALELASAERAAQAAANAALLTPQVPGTAAGPVVRARGHSSRYVGPGFYRAGGPANKQVRAVGHSVGYRGPGHYIAVRR